MSRLRCALPILFGLAVVLGWSSNARGQPAGGWTLKQCVGEALHRSHSLCAAAHDVDRAHAATRESDALRWPTLGVTANYTYTSEFMELDLPNLGGLIPPDIRFGDGNVYNLSLTAAIPLFTGGTLRSKAQADRAAFRAARHELAADSLRVLHGIRVEYFATLGAMAQVRAAEVAEGRLLRHIGELETAVEIGAASVENLVQARAQLRQAEQQRLALDAQAEARRFQLGHLLGRPDEEVYPAGDLSATLLEAADLETADIGRRPELWALDERVNQSERMASSAAGAYFPRVAAQLSYHHAKPGVDMIANEWMQYGSAGIVLTWPLWDWGARAQRVRQARGAGRALEEQRALLHDALRNALAVASSALESAREQEGKAEDRVRLEKQRLDLVIGRYERAAASESERLDAEDDLRVAEIALATAILQIRLAEAEVLYALGR